MPRAMTVLQAINEGLAERGIGVGGGAFIIQTVATAKTGDAKVL